MNSVEDETGEGGARQERSGAIFREVGVAYTIMFFAVLALALLSGAVPLVASNLYMLVAAVFLGVPWLWMERRGYDPAHLGVVWDRWARGVVWGLGFGLLTLIPFALGNHVWETQVRGREARVSVERFWQWPVALEGQPKGWGRAPGVWIWTTRQGAQLGVVASPKRSSRIILEGDTPFRPGRAQGGLTMRALGPKDSDAAPGEQVTGARRRWVLTPTRYDRPLRVLLPAADAPRDLTIRLADHERRAPLRLHTGASATPHEGRTLDVKRSLWWIVLWAVTQLFFIALPEEYAYRGFLQTRLGDAFRRRQEERDVGASSDARDERTGWLGMTRPVMAAIVATSALFGIGHLLIPVQGALLVSRASVFFPSLLFGWLRVRTGTIAAPTVYHACCNMMVILISVQYA